MNEILFIRRGDNYKPYYSADKLALDKKFKDGDTGWFAIRRPRNQGHHRKLFAMMDFVRARTVAGDLFQGSRGNYDLLKAIQHMIGEVDEVHKLDGTVVYEAKSISFDSMGQDKFELFYDRVFNYVYHKFFFGADMNYIRQELADYTEELRTQLEDFS